MDVCHVENPPALRIIQLESLFQGFHLVSQSGDALHRDQFVAC